MGNLTETDSWSSGVEYFAENAALTGGADCPDNAPIQALVNRSLYQRLRNVTPWNDTLAYPLNAYVSYNGITWKSVALNSNVEPGTDTTKWVRWGHTDAEVTALMGGTLSDHLAATDPHPQYMTPDETNVLIKAAVNAVLNGTPGALDTLKELADAIGDDANFAATTVTALAGKQALSTILTQIAALTYAADKLIYATGVNTFSTSPLTAFARTLLAAADAASLRALIGASDNVPTLLSQLQNDKGFVTNTDLAAAVTNLVSAAPGSLDTLKELADALGDDPNFATTIMNLLAQKAAISSVPTKLSQLLNDVSLLQYIEPAYGMDLNDYLTPGKVGANYTGSEKNFPIPETGTLDVSASGGSPGVPGSDTVFVQWFTSFFSRKTFRRVIYTAGFGYGPWELVPTATVFMQAVLSAADAATARAALQVDQSGVSPIYRPPEGQPLLVIPALMGTTIEFNSTTDLWLYVPDAASYQFPDGAFVNISNAGTGRVMVGEANSAAKLRVRDGLSKTLAGQDALATLMYRQPSDTWVLGGDLAPA